MESRDGGDAIVAINEEALRTAKNLLETSSIERVEHPFYITS